MKNLKILLSLAAVSVATPALAQGVKRVIVVNEEGVEGEVKLAIADGFASAIERAVNLNVARTIYGRKASNQPAKGSPLSFLIRTIADVNTALNETFMANAEYEKYVIQQIESRSFSDPWLLGFDTAKAPLFSRLSSRYENAIKSLGQGGTKTMTYEILTIPANIELPEPAAGSGAALARDSGMNLTTLMLQAAKVGDAKEYDKILDLYDQAEGFTAVDQATANAKELYRHAKDVYVQFTKDDAKQWMPVYLSVSLAFGDKGVTPTMRAILRPGTGMGGPVGPRGAEFDNQPPEKKVVQTTILDYVPNLSFNSAEPAAMAIHASSTFGLAEQRRSLAKLTWGRMPIADVRTITQCLADCVADLSTGSIGRHYPTINGLLNFEFIQVMKPNAENTSWWGKFKEGFKRRVNNLVSAGAQFAGSITEKGHFHIMLQTLAIEISPEIIRVVPNQSAFTMGIGDGKKAITINQANNSIGGVDLGMFGFDMYQKVAPELSAAFSSEINAQFSKDKLVNSGDFNEKQVKFMEALGPIVKVLNTY